MLRVALVTALLAGFAFADIVYLRNGGTVEGVVTEMEGKVAIKVGSGGTINVSRGDVARIVVRAVEPAPTPRTLKVLPKELPTMVSPLQGTILRLEAKSRALDADLARTKAAIRWNSFVSATLRVRGHEKPTRRCQDPRRGFDINSWRHLGYSFPPRHAPGYVVGIAGPLWGFGFEWVDFRPAVRRVLRIGR